MTSDKPSSQKLEWSPFQIQEFNKAKDEIKTLDTIYLPKSDDQLVMTSDYCKIGIHATLWAIIDTKFVVVARMSTRLEKAQENLLPCDGEATAIYVAGKCPYISCHILSSTKKTVALLDSKPVVQAANLLKQGKFSSSKLINLVLTAISELNMTFQHMTGKMGQNFADDHGSRNPISCSDRKNCKICGLVDDCTQLMVSQISFAVTEDQTIVGQIDLNQDNSSLVNEIIKGTKPIPFANRQAMKYLQDQDPILRRVRELLLAGEGPHPKEKLPVKRYLQKNINVTVASDGCLIVTKLGRKFVEQVLIVIPEDVSRGLLHGLHLNLNHPTSYQLQMTIDTRFFLLDRDKKIKDIWDNCTLCQSVAKIPVEIHSFKPNQMPDHPGKSFTVDILRTCKKFIMVTMENFSGFLTTTFLTSEKADVLLDGLIQTISPFKASSPSLVIIRTDKAPGFNSLKNRTAELQELGIDLDLGEPKNKNSTALVDRKMQELETEIKKLSPTQNFVSLKLLAKATTTVNEKIRKQGLSAKEILFSRDQYSHDNLQLEDRSISEEVMKDRNINNTYSALSKAQVLKTATSAMAKKGQVVFLKSDGSKLRARDLYLVTNLSDKDDMVTICKILNSFGNKPASIHPHCHTYTVKQTDIYLAPNQPQILHPEVIQTKWVNVYPAVETSWPPVQPSLVTVENDENEDHVYWVFEDEEENPNDANAEDLNPQHAENQEADAVPDNSGSEVEENSDDIEANDRLDDDDQSREHQTGSSSIDTQAGDAEANGENFDPDQNEIDDNTVDENSAEDGDEDDDEVGGEDDGEDDDQFAIPNRDQNPEQLPDTGDRIMFWNPTSAIAVKATVIPMHRSVQAQWPGWRNIKEDGSGEESSVNMDIVAHNCVSWRYLADVPQVDGNYTEENATTATPSTQDMSNHLRDIDTEHDDNSLELAREFANDPINFQVTLAPRNLDISPTGNILPNRVYRLPPEPVSPPRPPEPVTPPRPRGRRNRDHHRTNTGAVPKFINKLNPFKKK